LVHKPDQRLDSDSVTSIEDWTFTTCTSLISITIPKSVTHIGYGAFFQCTSLIRVTIPNSVTYMEAMHSATATA